jgi:hypothetical protein
MLVQRGEWDASTDPDTTARHRYEPRDFDPNKPQLGLAPSSATTLVLAQRAAST